MPPFPYTTYHLQISALRNPITSLLTFHMPKSSQPAKPNNSIHTHNTQPTPELLTRSFVLQSHSRHPLTVRGASLRLKGKIYRACVQRVLVYGSETWPMKKNDMQRLVRTENSMVRWMSGVTLKDRRRTKDLRKGLGIESVDRVVSRGRLRWFGHVERKGADDWVSECRRLEVVGGVG